MKVKVIYKGGIVEKGKLYKPGDVFETTLERLKALGKNVEVFKAVEKPAEDKMIHSRKVYKK